MKIYMQARCKSHYRQGLFLSILVLVFASSIACSSNQHLSWQRHALSPAEVLAESKASDWRVPDIDHLVYLYLSEQPIIIELNPEFAPQHVANIKKIVQSRFWDHSHFNRSQDNYVVQMGGSEKTKNKFLNDQRFLIAQQLEGEFEQSIRQISNLTILNAKDVYADRIGFSNGFHVGLSVKEEKSWLVHCYGTVGVSRAVPTDSGNGSSLYFVIGHAPRHLDRNITVVGRVLVGMDQLAVLPRGSGELGFYASEEKYVPILKVRMASEVSEEKRLKLRLLRTDTQLFQELLEARKFRKEKWFVRPSVNLDLCNMNVPIKNLKL